MRKNRKENRDDYQLYDRLPFGIILTTGQRVHYANKEAVRLCGNKDCVYPASINQFFDENVSSTIKELLRKRSKSEKTIDQGGKVIHVKVSPPGTKSKYYHIALTGIELSEKAVWRDELKESEKLFQKVLEAMGDAMVLTDLQGKVFRVNKEFERLTGFSEKEALGQGIPYSWFYEEDTNRFMLWISELREKNYLYDFDIRWRRKDNNIISVSLNTTLLRKSTGDPVAMLNIARDITKRKNLENELKERTGQIELINRVISKANETIDIDDLLYTLDHELCQILSFDTLGVLFLKDNHRYEKIEFTHNRVGDKRKKDKIAGEFKINRTLLKKWKKPIRIGKDSKVSQLPSGLPLSPGDFVSMLSVPVYSKETFFGILYITSKDSGNIQKRALSILQPLCEQIGLIVDKLNLFKKVRDDAQYIHNLLNSMDSIVFTVNNNLLVTETNTPLNEFPFDTGRRNRSLRNSRSYNGNGKTDLMGLPLYKVIANAPYRSSIEDVVRSLLNGEISGYTTEFSIKRDNGEKSYQLRINPMKIEEHIVGLVFSHTDITNLKQTEEELQRRNRDLIELNELSAVLTRSMNLQEVYRISLDRIRSLFNAHSVIVYLIDGDEIRMSGYAGDFNENEMDAIGILPLRESMAKEVLEKEKEVIVSSGLQSDARVSNEWRKLAKIHELQSAASVPLIVQKRIFGTLNLNFKEERELSEQELQLFLLIGNHLSAAIENIRLYSNLHARVSDLTILASLGTIYASTLDVNEIAVEVIDKVKRIRDPDFVSIVLYDDINNTNRMITIEDKNQTTPVFKQMNIIPDIESILNNPDDVISLDSDIEHPDIKNYLMYDVLKSIGLFKFKTEDGVVGFLSIGFQDRWRFQPEDTALFRNIAFQFSMAIQNAKLYRRIQDSEEKYRLLVEGAQDLVFSINLDGKFTYVSPSSQTLTGYSPDEILGMSINDKVLHPHDYKRLRRLLNIAASRKPSLNVGSALELRIKKKSGDYRWTSVSWTFIHDTHGNISGIQCILRDVHDRRLAEEQIKNQLNRLRVLYELAQNLSATLERKEILGAVLTGVKKIIPFHKFLIYLQDWGDPELYLKVLEVNDDIDQTSYFNSVPVSLDENTHNLEYQVLRRRKVMGENDSTGRNKVAAPMVTKERTLGLMVIERNGGEPYSEVNIDLLQTIAHLTGIAIEKALLYQETVDKALEIQRRNRELDDFTYVVSHDLKEPLITIEGYSKILLSDYYDTISQEGKELFDSITGSCNRMKNLINELLTLSRVGRMSERMSYLSLEEVIKDVLNDMEFTIRKRNARIILPSTYPEIYGNRVHLQMLFRNLISNGLKFNESEIPAVTIGWEDSLDYYKFTISDNGIGIEKEHFDKIFVIFHRLKRANDPGGMGAGLTIVKKIIETHGGDIWLTSEIGKGTTFNFTLPKTRQ